MTMSPRLLCAFLLVLAVLVVTEAQDPRRQRSLKDQILKGSESETKRDLKLLLNKLEAMRKRVSTEPDHSTYLDVQKAFGGMLMAGMHSWSTFKQLTGQFYPHIMKYVKMDMVRLSIVINSTTNAMEEITAKTFVKMILKNSEATLVFLKNLQQLVDHGNPLHPDMELALIPMEKREVLTNLGEYGGTIQTFYTALDKLMTVWDSYLAGYIGTHVIANIDCHVKIMEDHQKAEKSAIIKKWFLDLGRHIAARLNCYGKGGNGMDVFFDLVGNKNNNNNGMGDPECVDKITELKPFPTLDGTTACTPPAEDPITDLWKMILGIEGEEEGE